MNYVSEAKKVEGETNHLDIAEQSNSLESIGLGRMERLAKYM
jgi:hypothetical protein